MRRDLLYLDTKKGGMGMVKLTEEEHLVKLRLLSQIMQAGDRQRDMGQTPWAQKLLMEELGLPKEQTSKLIAGIKTQLEKLGVEISMKPEQTGKRQTEEWYQDRAAPKEMQDKNREQRVSSGTIEIKGEHIPTQLVTWAEQASRTQNKWTIVRELQEDMQSIKKAIQNYNCNTSTEQNHEGMRLRQGTLMEIEKLTKKKIAEWGIDLLTRSTEKIKTTPELLKNKEAGKTILLMNFTAHPAIREVLHAKDTKVTN